MFDVFFMPDNIQDGRMISIESKMVQKSAWHLKVWIDQYLFIFIF